MPDPPIDPPPDPRIDPPAGPRKPADPPAGPRESAELAAASAESAAVDPADLWPDDIERYAPADEEPSWYWPGPLDDPRDFSGAAADDGGAGPEVLGAGFTHRPRRGGAARARVPGPVWPAASPPGHRLTCCLPTRFSPGSLTRRSMLGSIR